MDRFKTTFTDFLTFALIPSKKLCFLMQNQPKYNII